MPMFEVLGETKDFRTNTDVVYVKAGIKDYINIVDENFDEFDIQRKRVKHSAYARMKQDITEGALLPPICLSVKIDYVDDVKKALEDRDYGKVKKLLNRVGVFNILDGLQRTHVIKDLISEGGVLKDGQSVLLEFWLEKNIKNLIYRIIVLNAGQKPMSMRHQIELLFQTAKDSIKKEIKDVEIFTERDEARRTKAKKYPLSRIALSYYAFVTKSSEVDKDNLVAMQLQENEILESGEDEFAKKFDRFIQILKKFTLIDEAASRNDNVMQWIASDNVMLSFFSAAGSISSRENGDTRIDESLDALIKKLNYDSNFFDLDRYEEVLKGINPKKINVGFATRKLLSSCFKEFMKDSGDVRFSDLWIQEAL